MSTMYGWQGANPGRRFPRGADCQWSREKTANVSLRQAVAAAEWMADAQAVYGSEAEVRCDRCEDLIDDGAWQGRSDDRRLHDICAPCYEWLQCNVDPDYAPDPESWWLAPDCIERGRTNSRAGTSRMSRFFVRTVPYAGDLPYLEFSVGGTMVFMTSKKAGTFDLYRALSPELTSSQQRDSGVTRQPSWAFLVSNGQDEVYLHENVARPTCTVRCRGSDTEIHIDLVPSEARSLATSLATACREPSSRVSRTGKARIRPEGSAYTYRADTRVLSFD